MSLLDTINEERAKCVHLHLLKNEIPADELKAVLSRLNLDFPLNEYGFCPHLVCMKSPEDGTLFADNTNDGYFTRLTLRFNIVECQTLEQWKNNVLALGNPQKTFSAGESNISNNNALF
jgi:hypothetical protein